MSLLAAGVNATTTTDIESVSVTAANPDVLSYQLNVALLMASVSGIDEVSNVNPERPTNLKFPSSPKLLLIRYCVVSVSLTPVALAALTHVVHVSSVL